MRKGDKVLGTICGFIQLGCIAGLTAIGLKRNNDCYKAECKLINTEFKLASEQIDNVFNRAAIKRLEKENEELKAKLAKEEESQ